MLGPGVTAVGVDRERNVGALERPARRGDRLRVPRGGDLDLDPAVSVGNRVFDPALEGPDRAIGRDAKRYAARNPRRGCNTEPFGQQGGDAGPATMGLEIPGRGLERGPGERVPAHALPEE